MRFRYVSPTRYHVEFRPSDDLKKFRAACTYRDKRVQFQLRRLRKNHWRDCSQEIAELEAKEVTCLYNETDGTIPSGLVPYLMKQFSGSATSGPPEIDTGSQMHWAVEPPSLRPYQETARQALLLEQHAAISLPTGSGKSLLAVWLVRTLGLKTVVMAPSINIANQLYADFSKYLGKGKVGKFYSGHKEPRKQIVIAVAASLTKVETDSPHWKPLHSTQVFIADEAHRTPAVTLEKVCFGLMASAPWRFFLSATQLREDGLQLLLQAITGPVVFEMTLRDGVDSGFLARPRFKLVEYTSKQYCSSKDAMEMNRVHLMHNPDVMRLAAGIAKNAVAAGYPVLILIDEVQQFNVLRRFLHLPMAFAHGPVSRDEEGKWPIPEEFVDSDPTQLVAEFNEGKHQILVGTSCISEGTDVRPVKLMLYLKGGKSEIDVRQSLGRCTRRVQGKDSCMVVDFDPVNVDLLHRHALVRKKIYNEVYPPVDVVTRYR